MEVYKLWKDFVVEISIAKAECLSYTIVHGHVKEIASLFVDNIVITNRCSGKLLDNSVGTHVEIGSEFVVADTNLTFLDEVDLRCFLVFILDDHVIHEETV